MIFAATSATESFGPIEGIVLFAGAVLGIAAIYILIFAGRRIHKGLDRELKNGEVLLKERSR